MVNNKKNSLKSKKSSNGEKKTKISEKKLEPSKEITELNKLINDAEKIIREKEKKWAKWYRSLFRKNNKIIKKVKHDNNGEKKSTEKSLENSVSNADIFIYDINSFLVDLLDTRDLANLLIDLSDVWLKSRDKEYKQLRNKNIILESKDFWVCYFNKIDHKKIERITKEKYLLRTWNVRIYESFLIYLISLYENFLQNMIKFMVKLYPNLLPKNKELLYKDFVKYSSFEEIQDFYTESYIRTVMWWNSLDQIQEIEKILKDENCVFTEILPLKELIEISSRRNLYVHNEWRINEQYIKNCATAGLNIEWKVWDKLVIDKDYFNKTFYIIYEITLKIAYLIFCKCSNKNEEIKNFDNFLNDNCIDLISDYHNDDKLNLWIKLLDFAYKYTSKNRNHGALKRYYAVNLALCYKMKWEINKCKSTLKKEDWSVATQNFQLALAVLDENWDLAANLMEVATIKKMNSKNMSEEGKFTEQQYQELPIFFEFRKTKQFKDKYKKIFKKEYIQEENNNL